MYPNILINTKSLKKLIDECIEQTLKYQEDKQDFIAKFMNNELHAFKPGDLVSYEDENSMYLETGKIFEVKKLIEHNVTLISENHTLTLSTINLFDGTFKKIGL